MTAATYEDVLRAVRQLQPAEQQRLLEALYEELEDADAVRAYDEAKTAFAEGDDELMTLEQATAELEAEWAAHKDAAA